MVDTELLPCPFCGGTRIEAQEIATGNSSMPSFWTVECGSFVDDTATGCISVGVCHPTKEGARKKWNTRHNPEPTT